jgi:hypothetical protein
MTPLNAKIESSTAPKPRKNVLEQPFYGFEPMNQRPQAIFGIRHRFQNPTIMAKIEAD